MKTRTWYNTRMRGMSKQANDNRDRIEAIRGKLLRGELTYDQAQEAAQPIINAMNERAKRICKDDGFKFKPISFKSLMR